MSQYINTPQNNPLPSVPGGAQRGPQTSGMAVVSMILGLISLFFFLCFGWLFGIVGLILGCISLGSIKKSPTTRKGSGMAITGIITSLLGLLAGVAFLVYAVNAEDTSGSSAPKSRLSIAESNVGFASGDQLGFGNTIEAKNLATSFAEKMKTLRDELFTAAKAGGMSSSKGKFLTHCELHENKVAFIVHVPKLRKFDDDAQAQLCDLAWMIGQSELSKLGFPEGGDVAVGVRGFALYEQIIVGKFYADSEKAEESIISRASSKSGLNSFFPAPEIPADKTLEASEAAY